MASLAIGRNIDLQKRIRGEAMKTQQDTFFDMTEERERKKTTDNQRRSWWKAFQKRSDELSQIPTIADGKCGYMAICDYCEGSWLTNPCAKALRNMAKERNIIIDFSTKNNIDDYL